MSFPIVYIDVLFVFVVVVIVIALCFCKRAILMRTASVVDR